MIRGKEIIAFPENIFTLYPNQSQIKLFEYYKNEWVVQIEATRARIRASLRKK